MILSLQRGNLRSRKKRTLKMPTLRRISAPRWRNCDALPKRERILNAP